MGGDSNYLVLSGVILQVMDLFGSFKRGGEIFRHLINLYWQYIPYEFYQVSLHICGPKIPCAKVFCHEATFYQNHKKPIKILTVSLVSLQQTAKRESHWIQRAKFNSFRQAGTTLGIA